jgi:muramoyltetrapeptide carboxypeptidase
MNEISKFPAPLKEGDKIAICSPAGPIAEENVTGAVEVLKQQGWEPVVMPHTLGQYGNYSGTDAERLGDLRDAFADKDVRAIICSRGGYGVVHIMEQLAKLPIENDPKWVVGFSDISALHAVMQYKGIASIHGSMTSHIKLGADDEDNASLFAILRGEHPAYTFPSHEYDKQGIAGGKLVGGNLAVIAELINTPFDIIKEDTILFIEDVSEPIYKIERILYQLRLSGVLQKLRGLVIGQFTEYKPDNSYENMEDMLRDMTSDCNYPIAFNAPVGHVFHNIPLIEGAKVTLKVSPSGNNSLIFWK